jgi:glycosyltransferase involved in cell wall biosynthesis
MSAELPAASGLSPDLSDWLAEFRRTYGRPPRLLHIGNIANNAYLAAKFLNRAGLDCDVICYDYYHVMGCPEWEDADYHGDIRNDMYPAWEAVDLRGFERPRWFVQGPFALCLDYLIARREGRLAEADQLWNELRTQGQLECAWFRGEISLPSRWEKLRVLSGKAIRKFWKLPYIAAQRVPALRRLADRVVPSQFTFSAQRACRAFAEIFADRYDRMEPEELDTYRTTFPKWVRLLKHYDLTIGYATDGLFPMLAGSRYMSFEHGTIRNLPFEASPKGRLCALTYRLARGTFITNCDNKVAADRIGIKNYRFVPHPINADKHPTQNPAALRIEVRDKLGADFVIFHPSRQHWSPNRDTSWDKGNDILIEGFARFVHEVNPKAGAVFVEWGQTLPQTRELIDRLGVGNRVIWIPPQPTPRMNAYTAACDVLADQFCIGAFGSTMPRGLMLGTPSLIYLNEEQHRWCMPEMPPVLNARTPSEVFAALKRVYQDSTYAQGTADAGIAWFAKYHSSRVVADAYVDAVREAFSAGGTR